MYIFSVSSEPIRYNSPGLIGDTSKFRKLTGWKPELSVDKILEDTLDYWRDFVKNNDY